MPFGHAQVHVIERAHVAEAARHAVDRDHDVALHLGTWMNAAMPARSWSKPLRSPTRVANT